MEKVKTVIEGMIGLEIHVYLVTKEKLFCKCIASREKGIKGNINICPICTGQPGAKPMLPNKTAVEKAVQIALMLECKINSELIWQRKHYNWPDLPKGYQNTLSGPNTTGIGKEGSFYGIKIKSMHLEEDPASWNPESGDVDYNRSGLPLVEIITEPDFSTAEEVNSWLKKLLQNLTYLKTVDSNAGIKVDVNVSIPGKTERVEIKNISSLENIGMAIDYELNRQRKEGNKKRETRRFNDSNGKTEVMRSKEEQEDYRFIGDPDLSPLIIKKDLITFQKNRIPESPDEKLDKLIKKYKIDKINAEILAKNIDIVNFFELIAEKVDPKFALPWITIELLRVLNYNKKKLDEVNIEPEHFIALLLLIKKEKITELQGKQILNKFVPKSVMPSDTESKITSPDELKIVIKEVFSKNPKAVESYKKGESNALNFLMGQIMSLTHKRADFKIARTLLLEMLK
ncbi:Asp-tRNA(Asn)/Glu-tRNA(Gln) amidotransferase subunit GatB [Candidatus Pacearchaeota archaeon]|nr:Asp-tRNA(Asn)/Glu-tRNA(Gln) amidotransferase subunit GatB [Candidatus Pacearchaeota archaeon]